jgi:hypothetical protein
MLETQSCIPWQEPHEATLRGAPQLSVPVSGPQAALLLMQKASSVSGMHEPH